MTTVAAMPISTCRHPRLGPERRGLSCWSACRRLYEEKPRAKAAERVRPDSRAIFPNPVFVDARGRLVLGGSGIRDAALIHRNFLFCLEPCLRGGLHQESAFRARQAGNPGRGQPEHGHHHSGGPVSDRTADRSRPEAGGPQAPELHRQPAGRLAAGRALQRFLARSPCCALRFTKATQDKGADGLSHGELSRSVFDAMQLRFDDYAADPEVRGPAKNATNDALRRVIDYYLYRPPIHELKKKKNWVTLLS